MEPHRLHRPEADRVDTARAVAVQVDVHGVPVLDRDHLRGLEMAWRAAGAGEARSGARLCGCRGKQPKRERQEGRDERTGTHDEGERPRGGGRLRMNTARMRMTRTSATDHAGAYLCCRYELHEEEPPRCPGRGGPARA